MKICKDCKHSSKTGYKRYYGWYSECNRWGYYVNLISGEEWPIKTKPCSKERSDLFNFDRCGKEGKYFEPKQQLNED